MKCSNTREEIISSNQDTSSSINKVAVIRSLGFCKIWKLGVVVKNSFLRRAREYSNKGRNKLWRASLLHRLLTILEH